MKTIIKNSSAPSLENSMVKPSESPLAFGSGYLRYLTAIASMDEDEPAQTRMVQPLRYLAAVEPLIEPPAKTWERLANSTREAVGQGFGDAIRSAIPDPASAPTLREAVIALRQRLLAS